MFPSPLGAAVVVPVEELDGVAELIDAYALCNPHARLVYVRDGKRVRCHEPVDPRWRSARVTAAHWYTAEEFDHLCDIARQLDWTVGDLVREFYSVTRKAEAKDVLCRAGLDRRRLRVSQLPRSDHARLLKALREVATEPSVDVLHPLGGRRVCARLGEGTQYKRIEGRFELDDACVPFVVEAALLEDPRAAGEVITAINHSPTLTVPWQDDWLEATSGRKNFDGTGLHAYLDSYCIDPDAPCRFFLHLTCPSLRFRDRGKSTIDSPEELIQAVAEAVHAVARRFAYREERRREAAAPATARASGMKLVDACRRCLTRAITHAAGRFRYVLARSVGYAIRKLAQRFTARPLRIQYFTQDILPRLLANDASLSAGIDIHYDARGHLHVPHEDRIIPIGTGDIRRYLTEPEMNFDSLAIPSLRARAAAGVRYRTILFVEKEGFTDLIRDAHIPERYDVLLASSKGQSVTALRELLDETQDRVVVLTLHDFDVAGFNILRALSSDTRRFKFSRPPKVIDLGLRLKDVRRMGLEFENVTLLSDPERTLSSAGATTEEIEFLRGEETTNDKGIRIWHARRVELNAMTNDQFVAWLDAKLKRHARKVVPNRELLDDAFREAIVRERLADQVRQLEAKLRQQHVAPPRNIAARVAQYLADHPEEAWDDAVADIARNTAASNEADDE